METKRIKLKTSTVCGGKPVKAGAEVDASFADAHFLVRSGKAEMVEPKKAEPKKVSTKVQEGEKRVIS